MGLTTYSNQAKIKILKVNKNIIKKYGAVSNECCKAMVQNLSKISKSKINVSITGIAGPGGGSKEKPVGLVYIGIKKGKTLLIKENKFKSKNRNSIQKSTVRNVIEMLILHFEILDKFSTIALQHSWLTAPYFLIIFLLTFKIFILA